MLVFSFSAYSHEWQYSIKHPGGNIETRKLADTDTFMFNVKDIVCSLNPNEDDEKNTEQYEFSCLSKQGLRLTFDAPGPNVADETFQVSFKDENDKDVYVEVTCFNYFSGKHRKPFEGFIP
jgi:hypothetical protein